MSAGSVVFKSWGGKEIMGLGDGSPTVGSRGKAPVRVRGTMSPRS